MSFAKKEKAIETKDLEVLQLFFPEGLREYFTISDYQVLCSLETKEEYYIIDFAERMNYPMVIHYLSMNQKAS